MPWAQRLAPLLPGLRSLRHRLHRSPEIAFEEYNTASAVAGWLWGEAGLTPMAQGVGGTGLIFRVEGSGAGSAAPSVLLRSELDGLPLIEASGEEYSSEIHGRHHACGHDGHACMLAAALMLLHSHRDEWSGVVYGLFQPAEETGAGALAVLADTTAMTTLEDAGGVQRAFSMHNIPQRPLGQVMVRPEGTMCRASMGLRIQLRGVQSHAAMPWEGNNPMLPLAKLAGVAAELPSWHPAADGEEPPICTLVHFNCGTVSTQAILQLLVICRSSLTVCLRVQRDYGVNPGVGDIGVTLRACSTAAVDAMAAEMQTAAEGIARYHNLACEVVQIDRFGATVNDAESSAIAVAAARRKQSVPIDPD